MQRLVEESYQFQGEAFGYSRELSKQRLRNGRQPSARSGELFVYKRAKGQFKSLMACGEARHV